MPEDTKLISQALYDCFYGESGMLEGPCVVDAMFSQRNSLDRIAEAITAPGAAGLDASGVTVKSLTEAVMGITGGLVAVAGAISELADAVRGRETP